MTESKFDPLDFKPLPQGEMIAASESYYLKMKRRRSVRDFSPRQIPMAVVENAIRAAGTAPSGANQQPWHFAVVTDPKVKKEIRTAAEIEEQAFYQERASEEWLEALQPLGTDANKPFLETAPCLIVIFLKKTTTDEDGVAHKNYYTSESVGIATGMLISALHLSGLPTLTHTPSPMQFLNQILDRPKSERPYLVLVVGYPSEGAQVPRINKYSLEEIATYF